MCNKHDLIGNVDICFVIFHCVMRKIGFLQLFNSLFFDSLQSMEIIYIYIHVYTIMSNSVDHNQVVS